MAEMTADQLSDFRKDIGDEDSDNYVFTETEINRLFTRADSDYDRTVILALEQLITNAAKFADYTVGQTTERRSQVFDQLVRTLDIKRQSTAAGDQATVFMGQMESYPVKSRDVPSEYEDTLEWT